MLLYKFHVFEELKNQIEFCEAQQQAQIFFVKYLHNQESNRIWLTENISCQHIGYQWNEIHITDSAIKKFRIFNIN